MRRRAAGLAAAVLSAGVLLQAACSGGPAPVAGPSQRPPDDPPMSGVTSPTSIWHPTPGTTWQWQLTPTVDTRIEGQVYDIDMDIGSEVVTALHAKGTKVICYFEAGTREDWRADAGRFPPAVVGKEYKGWPGERWLDIRDLAAIGPIMTARLDQCKRKGFDGVEFDSVAAFQEKTGFPLTANDQLRYNRWLAEQAHARGMAAALKNDLDQVTSLVSLFDFSVNEQCFEFDECDKLLPFIAAGKAVFNTEYNLDTSRFCARAREMRFSSMKKHKELDAWREACW